MALKHLLVDDVTGKKKLGATPVTIPDVRSQTSAISSGVKTLSVTFSSAMPSSNYAVIANMVNTTDSNPQFQPVTITAKSTTGFTAKWNADTDSANYSLESVAFGHV